MSQQLMSASDFATTVGVTLSCVRRWIFEKRIATVKLGRLVRIPVTEVERILNAGLRPATKETAMNQNKNLPERGSPRGRR